MSDIEQKRKRTHGHGQQGGDCSGERDTRGLNGNVKNTIKIIKKRILICQQLGNHKNDRD